MGQAGSRQRGGPSSSGRDSQRSSARPPTASRAESRASSYHIPASISNSLRRRSLRPSVLLPPSQQPPSLPSDSSLDLEPSGSTSSLARRRSRLIRARSSIATSIPSLFGRHSQAPPWEDVGDRRPRSPDGISYLRIPRPAPRQSASDPGYQLPHLEVPSSELDISFDDFASNPEVAARSSTRREGGRTSSFISERMSALRPDRGIRSMTSSLRRRRSPLRREEDQAAMLSRLLSVAAAATAASLMGDANIPASDARGVSGDSDDGSFAGFLQSLQNGRIASALRQSGGDSVNESETGGTMPAPLNFFRMFRFGTTTGQRRSINHDDIAHGRNTNNFEAQSNRSGDEDATDDRMVPIIIVGIRSISPGSGSSQDDNIPPFLDALSNIPANFTSPGEATIDGILRQPQNGTRFSHRRRASIGGMNTFPANYDSQRHHRSPDRSRPWSTISESPSGPRPPPSTPASNNLSALSSGSTTPTFSSSSASAAPSRRGSFIRRTRGSGLESTAEEPHSHLRTSRPRRLSESDFTPFSPGGPRRNGVVEPDNAPVEGSRSWIIYVLGGSYPENHPILTTPSLFTDSPTYEDMLLLSALLGPAKPPVASEADVAAAPGLFRIESTGDQLLAVEVHGDERIEIMPGSRCLVCLCDFEIGEEARRLIRCDHYFHRECIDQWLTTGRNSCPLCRGQGVDEKSGTPAHDQPDSVPSIAPSFV